MSKRGGRPELLAPAGDLECLHAAVAAGADAVYLGLSEFNARRNAGNFTLETLADACNWAHMRGVDVYVTMNVAILPTEIKRAVELARNAFYAGADAFIVQDIGLAADLAAYVPDAPLHISTQMNIHNAAGIVAAARLGAKRVTLARELTVAEISELASLASEFGMEVECFAHGALCICYSGQCLMSSMIGGRSANRGLCAQACRLPYELHRADREGALDAPGEHLLSPKDLCAIDLLSDMAAAGVASFKIEGRMKSADYVHEVVSVYREVLDGSDVTDAHRARLAEAFSRGFTTAYLEGERGNEIMSYGRPNNRGVFAGRVARVRDGVAEVAAEIELHEGDVLEFWTNRGHFAAQVGEVKSGRAGGRAGAQASTVSVPVEQKTGKGDRVFRVRNAAAAFDDDPFEPRIAVRGSVQLRIGKPAHIVFEAGSGSSYARGEATGAVVEPARTKAITRQDVLDHVNRLGNTSFKLADPGDLKISLDEGVGMGFSALHHLRADALDDLATKMLGPYTRVVAARDGGPQGQADSGSDEQASGTRALSADGTRRAGSRAGERRQDMQVMAWVANPGCARAARRAGAECMYVPLLNFRRGQAQVAGVLSAQADQAGYPKQCVMALSAIDHDPVAPSAPDGNAVFAGTRENDSAFDMWDYVRAGKTVFADNLGDAVRALELGARVEIGPHVPVTNGDTLRVLADWGVSHVWLSPELTLGQIADLVQDSPVELGLFVSGAQELMITEHCLLMSQGACAQNCTECSRRGVAHRLVDRKGFDFPVVTDMLGRSHLYNGVELDVVPVIPDLVDIGISAVMVDTTLLDKKAAADAVGRAVRARDLAVSERRAVAKRPNATTGHLFRGVS